MCVDIHETKKHDKLCACCQHLPSIHVCPPGTENIRTKRWDSLPASVSLLTPDSCPRPSISTKSSSGLAMSGCAEPEPGLVHTAILSFQLGPQRSLTGLASKLPWPRRPSVREAEGGVRATSHSGQGLGSCRFPLGSRRPPAVQKRNHWHRKPAQPRGPAEVAHRAGRAGGSREVRFRETARYTTRFGRSPWAQLSTRSPCWPLPGSRGPRSAYSRRLQLGTSSKVFCCSCPSRPGTRSPENKSRP